MKSVDVSIIIVSYNTKDFVINCIKSIMETTKKFSYEIIVVDNASLDNSVEAVKSVFKNKSIVKIIKNKDNYGFSKANNVGLRESFGRYILFLNPDTIVYKNTLDGMIDFMDKNPKAGASTCFLRMPNGKLDDASHRGFPTPLNSFFYFLGLSKLFPKIKFFSGYNLSYLDFSKTHEIDALAGAFMLVRKEAGKEVGWWDEDYFWYGEDIDFCYNLKEKGWRIYFVPKFEILHYKGVSGGIKKISKDISTASKQTKNKAIDSRFQAMTVFYSKHYKNKYPAIFTFLILFAIKIKWYLAKQFSV